MNLTLHLNKEHAEQAKQITEKRSDIKEVFIQENNIQTKAWEAKKHDS